MARASWPGQLLICLRNGRTNGALANDSMPVGPTCATACRCGRALLIDNRASFQTRDPETATGGNNPAHRIAVNRVELQRFITHPLKYLETPRGLACIDRHGFIGIGRHGVQVSRFLAPAVLQSSWVTAREDHSDRSTDLATVDRRTGGRVSDPVVASFSSFY